MNGMVVQMQDYQGTLPDLGGSSQAMCVMLRAPTQVYKSGLGERYLIQSV